MYKPSPSLTHMQHVAARLVRERQFKLLLRGSTQVVRARWALRRAEASSSVRLTGSARVVNHGRMSFGDRVRLDGGTVRLEFVTWARGELRIGANTFINYGTTVSAVERVEIGKDCNIGQYCIIMDSDYHSVENHHLPGESRPVVIQDDVWLGARTVVLRGSTIGRGSVIGANSVVTGEIPPYSVAAGSPARVLRRLREVPDASR